MCNAAVSMLEYSIRAKVGPKGSVAGAVSPGTHIESFWDIGKISENS